MAIHYICPNCGNRERLQPEELPIFNRCARCGKTAHQARTRAIRLRAMRATPPTLNDIATRLDDLQHDLWYLIAAFMTIAFLVGLYAGSLFL